ncbi:MAG: MFS transporter [Myxococcota bacterium]
MGESRYRRLLAMLALVIAGEAIFGLPFQVARFFRPTLLLVFDITNTELGAAFAAYGVLAMVSYFPGGPLADYFSARRLITASLIVTGCGGFYFATIPGGNGLRWLYGFFGLTSILLFWAALIRATREWGGEEQQGRAFGVLDAGRGLTAAILASTVVTVLASLLPDASNITSEQRRYAFQVIVWVYTGITFAAALLTWFAIPESKTDRVVDWRPHRRVLAVLRMPAIWMQAVIVISAYVAYKSIDNFSVYGTDVWGMNEVEASRFLSISAWVRVLAALGAGFLADKLRATWTAAGAFAILILSLVGFVSLSPADAPIALVYVNLVVTCAAVFGLRGVYYAMFSEARVPHASTGTATGVVSVIGYTPDVFVGYATGVLIDYDRGLVGHRNAFLFVIAFALCGLIASIALARWCARLEHP